MEKEDSSHRCDINTPRPRNGQKCSNNIKSVSICIA